MNYREKLYDLKNQKKALLDECTALALEGKHEDEEYKSKTARIAALKAQIETVEGLLEQDEGGEDPAGAEKALHRAAAGKGGDGYAAAVKAFAAAARAGFPATKAAGDTLNETTPADGGYTVPEDIVTRVEQYRQSKASLRDLVSVETVSAPTGRRTFQTRAQQTGFTAVSEGGKIPKQNGPQFEVKTYAVKKYGGFFAVTNELLEDSDENITATLVEWIGDEARVTDNKLILAAINEKTAEDLTDLDGIKKALYVTLDAAFRATSRVVTNADGVYWLSTLQDANGRDLLTPIPSEPGKMQIAIGARVFPVEEYPNADLPTTENKVPFILGDLKAGVRLFDRKLLTLTASNVAAAGDFNAYEQDMTLTRAIERLDVKQWDAEAFVNGYIDVTAAAEG